MDQTKDNLTDEEIMKPLVELCTESAQLVEDGDLDESFHKMQQARDLCETLMRENPDLEQHLHEIELDLTHTMSNNRQAAGEAEQNRQCLQELLDRSTACIRQYPASAVFRMFNAMALNDFGAFHADRDCLTPALDCFRKASSQLRKVPKEERDESYFFLLAGINSNAASAHLDLEEPAKALTCSKLALNAATEMIRLEDTQENRTLLQAIRMQHTDLLLRNGRPEESSAILDDMLQLSERMAEENPDPENRLLLANTLKALAVARSGIGRQEEALPPLRRSIGILDKLSREESDARTDALDSLCEVCLMLFTASHASADDRNRSATVGIRSGRILHRELGPGPWDEVVNLMLQGWNGQ